eukprot:CAMPEP_0119346466 /NCGR_PEP_ID=MMETSP1333-20130426/108017_1 /TAXON_ID=418940 /ORGANISM="Scyphosphaera apsteinii, Strain RCC1455" /LENGTH=817 /DNA_ID=CAMNT_0007358967 /DNA_START=57 /DNA_END=2510 /DNA_ORIENTATION=-
MKTANRMDEVNCMECSPWDLVLCDVCLGEGISGVEVMIHLRRAYGLGVSIIMVSSNEETTLVEKCILEGADSYMLKPVRTEMLITARSFVLRRQRQAVAAKDLIQSPRHQLDGCTIHQTPDVKGRSSPQRDSLQHCTASLSLDALLWHSKRKALRHTTLDPEAVEAAVTSLLDTPNMSFRSHRSTASSTVAVVQSWHERMKRLNRSNCVLDLADTADNLGNCHGAEIVHTSDEVSPTASEASPAASLVTTPANEESHVAIMANQASVEVPPSPIMRRSTANGVEHVKIDDSPACVISSQDVCLGDSQDYALCRLCEGRVQRACLTAHATYCAAQHKERQDGHLAIGEVQEMQAAMTQVRRQALHSLIIKAMEEHRLVCSPLEQLYKLSERLVLIEAESLEPLARLRMLTQLMRELVFLLRTAGGGSNFEELASNLQALVALRLRCVQELIKEMDRTLIDNGSSSSPIATQQTHVCINDFTLLSQLNTGRFASVWLAKKNTTGDVFALKTQRIGAHDDHLTSSLVAIERTILFNHTSDFLLRCFFCFRSSQHIIFALEYMAAGDLSAMLFECGRLSESAVQFYMAECLAGMYYLHEHDVIHRDIKPQNVLIAKNGHVKLADFGLSTSTNRRKKCGTLPYMAPEVLEMCNDVSGAIDLWSIGVMVHELMTGQLPFSGEETAAGMLQNVTIRLKSQLSMPFGCLELSEPCTQVIQDLLVLNPSQRLGFCHKGDLLGHAFFAGVEWDELLNMRPPFVPVLKSESDDTYFEWSRNTEKLPSFTEHQPSNAELGFCKVQPYQEVFVNVKQLLQMTMECTTSVH